MIYKTQDFWLAIWLKANGCYLTNVEKDKNRHVFIFENVGIDLSFEDLIKQFYGNGIIKINSLRTAYEDVKSSIYNFR